jgi:hypothetical protein
MKKISALALAASLAASTAFAGGPVIIPVEPEPVVVVGPTSSINGGIVVPLLLLLLVGAAVAAND